jgi:hypothetical protein
MVPILSSGISDFTLADTGNLAGTMPGCARAFSSRGSCAGVTGWALGWRLSHATDANHACRQRSRVRAAPPRGQRREGRRGVVR